MYRSQAPRARLMHVLPGTTFARTVQRYHGNRRVRRFPGSQRFRALACGLITGRESLRGSAACLAAQPATLCHCGFRRPVPVATRSRANQRRDWRMQAGCAQRLIARALYADRPLDAGLADTVCALDSRTIDRCLSVFPRATFRATKAAVRLHALLALHGAIPTFLHLTDGKFHAVSVLDIPAPEPGAIYVTGRACIGRGRLCLRQQTGAFFVTRTQKTRKRHRVDSRYTRDQYPEQLRRVPCRDPDSGRKLACLTHRTAVDALTICNLYKSRWQVEPLSRNVRRTLRLQRFRGLSENAVKTQLGVAVSVYVLAAIIRKRLGLERSLHQRPQVLAVTPCERLDWNQARTEPASAKAVRGAVRPIVPIPLVAPHGGAGATPVSCARRSRGRASARAGG